MRSGYSPGSTKYEQNGWVFTYSEAGVLQDVEQIPEPVTEEAIKKAVDVWGWR